MSAIEQDHFSGGSNLQRGHGSKDDLATILRGIADDLAGNIGLPQWLTGITVTTNVATLASAGWVVAVHATAGTTPGPKQQIQGGSPAAGQVDVAYSAGGVATLTFNGTDAITATAVTLIPYTAPVTTKV